MKERTPLGSRTASGLAFLLSMLLLGVSGWMSHASVAAQRGTAQWVTHTHEVLETLERFRFSLAEAESLRRGYAISADAGLLVNFATAIEEMGHNLKNVRRLTSDNPSQQERIRRLEPLAGARQASMKEKVDRQRAAGVAVAAPGAADVQAGVRQSTEILDLVSTIEADERALLVTRERDTQSLASRAFITMTLGMCLSAALLGGIFWFLLRDISQRRAAEEALAMNMAELDRSKDGFQAQTRVLESILDGMSDGVVVADGAGNFTLFNSAAERILGIGSVPSNPKDWSSLYGLFHTDERTPFPADRLPLARALRGEESHDVELFVRNERIPSGVSISVNGRPLRDAQGVVKGGIAVFHDITARKLAEARRLREITLLNELGELLQACHTAEEAYDLIGRKSRQLFAEESGAACMINPSGHLVEAKATWGSVVVAPASGVFLAEDCWALRRGQAHFMADAREDLACAHLPRPLPDSSLCVPLGAEGVSLGVLTLAVSQGTGDTGSRLGEDKRRLASTVGRQVSLTLANLRLRETLHNQSIRDPLTQLFNRRFLDESLERETFRSVRSHAPIGVIMIDVDHFKQFNDSFGHEAGDAVLKALGDMLKSRVRGGDIACRYGGEEMTLVLPGATLEETRKRAEAVREAAGEMRVAFRSEFLPAVSLSLGVSAYPDQGVRGEDLLRAADQALYRAKREGRDRVVVAPVEVSQGPGSALT